MSIVNESIGKNTFFADTSFICYNAFMIESENSGREDQKQQELKRYISLAEALSQRLEGLPFPGIDEETLRKLIEVDEEYPGYVTPIDEIIARMEKEGIKIVLGEDRESGNVFALPFLSDDIEMDSLLPRHLVVAPDMDESLRSLILANKARFASEVKEAE